MLCDISRAPSYSRSNNASAHETTIYLTKEQQAHKSNAEKSLKHIVKQVNFNLDVDNRIVKEINTKTRNTNLNNSSNKLLNGLNLNKSNTQSLMNIKYQPLLNRGSVVSLNSEDKPVKPTNSFLNSSDSRVLKITMKQPIKFLKNVQSQINFSINQDKKGISSTNNSKTFFNLENQGSNKKPLISGKPIERVEVNCVKENQTSIQSFNSRHVTKKLIVSKQTEPPELSNLKKKKSESIIEGYLKSIDNVDKKYHITSGVDPKKVCSTSTSEAILDIFPNTFGLSEADKIVRSAPKKSETDSLISAESIFEGKNFTYL
jgi:hypothetical protein